MSYGTATQGRPIQGVSQQPDRVRLPGQCTESINYRPDVVSGLVTRPGTLKESVLEEDIAFPDDVKWHYYDRGTGEEYFIAVNGVGDVRVWDRSGVQQGLVVAPEAKAYLASPDPRTCILPQTVGDTTFLLNNTVNVQVNTDLTPSASNTAILYPQFADYAQRIEVYMEVPTPEGLVKQQVGYYQTADGANSDDKFSVATSYVTDRIYQMLLGWSNTDLGGFPTAGTDETWVSLYNPGQGGVTTQLDTDGVTYIPLYEVELVEGTIQIKRADGQDFQISVDDDADGGNVILVKGAIESTSKLPAFAPEGFLVEIDPPGSRDKAENFWLKAEIRTDGTVRWVETVAPALFVGLNASTMPVQLVREDIIAGVAQFSLELAPWEDRRVGDDRTNPMPSFVDTEYPRPINSLGVFQNRLYVTSGEAVIMTRTSKFYDFFRESAQVALDTDPIDVFADSDKVQVLKSSQLFDGDLVFFSDVGQSLLLGQEPVTPSNATLIGTTSFESNLDVRPVASGDSIFFAFDYGQFTGIREYFTDSLTDTKRARPVTDHVNKYIEGKPLLMVTSTSLNLLIIRTYDHPDRLYVYEWLWQGAEKVQSAWGYWDFGEGSVISDVRFSGTDLLIIIRRGNGTVLERMDLGDAPEFSLEYPLRLDSRVEVNCTYESINDRWIIVDPLPEEPESSLVVVRGNGCNQPGLEVSFEREGEALVSYENLSDATQAKVYVGVAYKCRYVPTNPVPKDSRGETLSLDRLTVGKIHITYEKTGNVTATVENNNGNSRQYKYGNRKMGSPENLVGYDPQVAGEHVIPIRRASNTYQLNLETDDHRPTIIRDIHYDGTLSRRGRRF